MRVIMRDIIPFDFCRIPLRKSHFAGIVNQNPCGNVSEMGGRAAKDAFERLTYVSVPGKKAFLCTGL
jgi:hypothetical protein